LVNGLCVCVHNFALLSLPVYLALAGVLVIRRKLPVWSLATAAVAYLVGAGLYGGMIVDLAVRSGDWLGAVRSALVGKYSQQVLNVTSGSMFWKENAALSAMNFINLLLPLAIVGWLTMRRTMGTLAAVVFAALTLIHILFFVRYPVPDQATFLLPTLVILHLAAGLGILKLVEQSTRWRLGLVTACLLLLLAQPVFYAAAPRLVERLHGPIQRSKELPFRDEARYWLVPWKHNERSAACFAEAALHEASPNGVILPDSTSAHPLLLFQRLYGLGKGVTVEYKRHNLPDSARELQAFRDALGDRPLYVVDRTAGFGNQKIATIATLVRQCHGVLYAVKWKKKDRIYPRQETIQSVQ